MLNLNTHNKFVILVIIISSVLVVTIAWLVINGNQTIIMDSYNNFGQVVAHSLSPEISDIMTHHSEEESRNRIDQLAKIIIAQNNDVAKIRVISNEGRIIYSDPNNETQIDDPIIVSAPLKIDDQIAGTVQVYLTGKTKKLVGENTRNSLLLVFTIIWIISILAVCLNTYLITRNLSTIVEGVKRVSIGEFGYRVLSKDLWGEVKQLVEAFNDMSERLSHYEDRNIDQLTYERNKLEAVLLSIANGVVVCDRVDEIVIVNNAAIEMLKASSDDLTGLKIQNYIDDINQHSFSELVNQFKNTPLEQLEREPLNLQLTISNRIFQGVTSPIFDSHQDYLGYVIILHDITKETEIDKLKSDFISNVSHELRTPVTVLRSYVDTLAHYSDEFDDKTKQEFMHTIDEHVTRLNEMVNNILDFSRLEKDEFKMEFELGDILPIVELTVKSIEKLASDKDIIITKAYETNLPNVYINNEVIEKIMRNLLSNAIKYTPIGGKIRVKVQLDETENNLEVSVKDNGIGIAEHDLPRLFDRFYRVENAVHTEVGTGIGLEIVKKSVEKHHGEVFVESELGKGSVFGFRLPLKPYMEPDLNNQSPQNDYNNDYEESMNV